MWLLMPIFWRDWTCPCRWYMLFFTSYRGMQPLEPALNQASAVVLGHSSEADIQQYVAGVIFAKVLPQGKLSMSIGSLYQAGEGSVITPVDEARKYYSRGFGDEVQ